MTNTVLNILTLGIKPLLEKQGRLHSIIVDFREKLSKRQEGKLSIEDVEDFYRKINNFDFSFVFFARYYRNYIENLNRFKPQTEEENPDITFLLIAIAEDKWKPTKPSEVFKHHIKYKYPLTSHFFISRQKKENQKKLNSPGHLSDLGKKKSFENAYRLPVRNRRKEQKQ